MSERLRDRRTLNRPETVAKSHDRRPSSALPICLPGSGYRLRVACGQPIAADSQQTMPLGQVNSRIHAMSRISPPLQCQHRAVRCGEEARSPLNAHMFRQKPWDANKPPRNPFLMSLTAGGGRNRVGPRARTACGLCTTRQEGHLDRWGKTDRGLCGGFGEARAREFSTSRVLQQSLVLSHPQDNVSFDGTRLLITSGPGHGRRGPPFQEAMTGIPTTSRHSTGSAAYELPWLPLGPLGPPQGSTI